jgi:hypothetical protein
MKKSVLLIFASLVFHLLPVQGQRIPVVKMTQDSIVTEIVGNKSVTSIYVTATRSYNYKIGLWMMGVKHSDGSYSSYQLIINGVPQTDSVFTSKGDWQFVRVGGQGTFHLNAGADTIQLIGTPTDIPTVEEIIGDAMVLYSNHETNYELTKTHQDSYPPSVSLLPEVDYNKEFHYSMASNDSTYPPCYFTAHLDRRMYYTFYRQEYYTAGQTVTFQTDTLGGVHHVLHVFSKGDPSNHTWTASSTEGTGGHAQLTVYITRSDYYYILVRAREADAWGTCNLRINSDRIFENVPVNNLCTDIYVATPFSDKFVCFAKSSSADPMIFILNDTTIAGNIINYNNDYPYNQTVSSYNWGKNARVNMFVRNKYWMLTTSKCPIVRNSAEPLVDSYTGCKYRGIQDNDFPYYFVDDYMYSSAPSTYYNCISWALGEWMIGYWLDDKIIDNQFVPGLGHEIATIDSLFSIYGLSRTGATSNNADVDLWGTVNGNGTPNCLHASVKAKRHRFAAGYDWESKLGSYVRVFHPRYALENGVYGNVIAHYHYAASLPGPSPDPKRIILNVGLSPTDTQIITSKVSSVSRQVRETFEDLYDRCEFALTLQCQ